MSKYEMEAEDIEIAGHIAREPAVKAECYRRAAELYEKEGRPDKATQMLALAEQEDAKQ